MSNERIVAKETAHGWGGLRGVTIHVSAVERGKEEGLGLIFSDGRYSPESL